MRHGAYQMAGLLYREKAEEVYIDKYSIYVLIYAGEGWTSGPPELRLVALTRKVLSTLH